MKIALISIVACCLTQAACSPSDKNPSPADVAPIPLAFIVEQNEDIPLVLHVRWLSDVPQKGWVEYQVGDGPIQSTPIESNYGTRHSIDLLGLHPLSEVSIHAYAEDEVGRTYQGEGLGQTGSLSSQLPQLTVSGNVALSSGFTLIPLLTAEGSTTAPSLVIVDSAGEIVWYKMLPNPSVSTEASFSIDKKSIYLHAGWTVVQIPINGDQETVFQTPDGHHSLVEVEAGTIAYLRTEYGEYNGKTILGDAIVEMGPDGQKTEVWNFFDHLSDFGITEFELGQMPHFTDLTHGNSIEYVRDEDAYYVNFTSGMNAVFKVDRANGETLWALGNSRGNVQLNSPETFELTHQLAPLNAEEFMMFVNITDQSECARIAHVSIDESTASAEANWLLGESECLTVFGLGGVQRLSNGNTMAVWSTAGRIEEFDPQFELIKRIDVEFGYAFGYSQHVESLYAAD